MPKRLKVLLSVLVTVCFVFVLLAVEYFVGWSHFYNSVRQKLGLTSAVITNGQISILISGYKKVDSIKFYQQDRQGGGWNNVRLYSVPEAAPVHSGDFNAVKDGGINVDFVDLNYAGCVKSNKVWLYQIPNNFGSKYKLEIKYYTDKECMEEKTYSTKID